MIPCIHGEVCREYARRFGTVKKKSEGLLNPAEYQTCILSVWCPHWCDFYEPKEIRKDRSWRM